MDRRSFAALLAAPMLAPALRLAEGALGNRVRQGVNPPDDVFMKDLGRIMEIAGVPGIAMGVVRDRRLAWQHYQGVMDTRTNERVSADTMWPAASLSKPVFALAVLRLVDEGKLDLDRPLKSYAPGHAPDDARGDTITARHVLSHSSGLRNWRNRTDQPLVPAFDPGTRFQYSGEGIYYLQHAVERITDMPFARFIEERLLAPLGMTSSTYLWNKEAATRLVSGHDQGQVRTVYNKEYIAQLERYADAQHRAVADFRHEDMVAAVQAFTPPQPPVPNFLVPNAAGSLLTTVGDYSAFLVELLYGGNKAVDLAPRTLTMMTTPQTRINSALSWGLGVGIEESARDGSFLWHWGDNGAWKNFMVAHPRTGSALVVFTNGSRGLNVARRAVAAATGDERAAFLWL